MKQIQANKASQGLEEIHNSELKIFAEDILGQLKYSFATVAANPSLKVSQNSIESKFRESIKSFKKGKQKEAQKNSKSLLGASKRVRKMTFGRAGMLEPKEFITQGAFDNISKTLDKKSPLIIDKKKLGIKTPTLTVPIGSLRSADGGVLIPKQALPDNYKDLKKIRAKIAKKSMGSDGSKLRSEAMLMKMRPRDDDYCPIGRYGDDCVPWGDGGDGGDDNPRNPPNNGEGPYAKNTHNNLRLYIKRIKCVDDTKEWSDDEIDLAGVSTDATGDTKKIGNKRISNSFEDGDSKHYNPHWKYVDFTLSEDGDGWPKYYAVSYLLAEIDNGGISDALDKLWKGVRAKVMAFIKKYLESETEGNIIWSKILPAVLGVISWVLTEFVKWISNLFKDDIFKPFLVKCSLLGGKNNFYHRNGQYHHYSESYQADFRGHGGHYVIDYYWSLI